MFVWNKQIFNIFYDGFMYDCDLGAVALDITIT